MNDPGLINSRRIQAFYEAYSEITGNNLGWESPISAVAIYNEASNSLHQNWGEFTSLLDVGSGEGHFFEFLRAECGFKGLYLGIEILPMFYETALKNYGLEENVNFLREDFLKFDFGETQFDWVISLGSLAVKQDSQVAHDRAMCQKMLQLARYGVSIYINDPKNTPIEQRNNIPDLAWHDTRDFIDMLDQLGANDLQVVDFFVNPTSKGTMLHIRT